MGKGDLGSTGDAKEVPRPGNHEGDYPGEKDVSREELRGSQILDVEVVDQDAHLRHNVGRVRPNSKGRSGADVASGFW